MTKYVIEWSGTFDTFPIIDLDTGKVTHIPHNYIVTKGPTIKEKRTMTEGQTPFCIGLLGLYGLLALLVILRNFYSVLAPLGLVLLGGAIGLFIVAIVAVYWLIPTEGGD